ncbi:RNA polymerase subunit sigma-70 [Sorangium sp. So ce385]|uniref:RNA polymerase subunit sigma-70 n=1 Tax=Sorangium sp. So ce385 TaxID=3133308 RepID=UPI003F5BB044
MPHEIDPSFLEAIAPLRGPLRLHCYRMLGSSHDSDDLVQETLLRAWRARDSLEDGALLRPWLYRIATNACLDELKRRPKRAHPADARPAADPHAPVAPASEEPEWIEPAPDVWLEGADEAGPAARYTLKESVALAFVAALSILSPVQRATLLLRDVVGLSAEETAGALGIGLSAANSALFRARRTVEEKLGGRGASAFAEAATEVDEALLARYVRAFEDADVGALVALLHDDVRTAMPPSPTWIAGRAANEAFFRARFATFRCAAQRAVRTAANGQPAFALYRRLAPGQPLTLHAIQVLTVRAGAVASIDHFMIREVFPVFGLPAELGPG